MCHKVILSQAARIKQLEHDRYGHDWWGENTYDDAGLWYQAEWEPLTAMDDESLAWEDKRQAEQERIDKELLEKEAMMKHMWDGYYIPINRFWAGHSEDEMDFDVPLNSIERLLQKDF